MKKITLLLSVLFVFSAISTTAFGQQGNAILKIVKSEDGSVKVYDMQGNEVNHTNRAEDTSGLENQDDIDASYLDAMKELERLEDKDVVTGHGATVVDLENSTDPEVIEYLKSIRSLNRIESRELKASDWKNASDPGDLFAIEKMLNSISASEALNPGPDLTWTGGSWNFMSYTAPLLSVTIRVENNGTTAAGASYVGYYLSTDNTITTADYLLGSDYVSALAAGATSTESITINLCSVSPTIPSGTYYVGIYCDYLGQVVEDDETNNGAHYGSTIAWSQTDCADLSCWTGSSYNSYTFHSSSRLLDINCRVKNFGTGSAGASTLGYYLSSNSSIETSDTRVGTDFVDALAPDAHSDEAITGIDVCSYVSPGTWYVGFIIDYLNVVAESDETNNNWLMSSAAFTFSACPTANLTCFTGAAYNYYSFDNSTCTLSYNVRVKNNGTTAAGASVLGYYLSENSTIELSDTRFGTDGVSALAPGSHSDESISADISSVVAPGTWFVGFYIDYTDLVDEIDETDNNWYTPPAIDVNCECSITVTSPVGGEEWDENTVHEITWDKTGACSQVTIKYSMTGAAPWTLIDNATDNDGSYTWTLPDVSATQTQCKVKIWCNDGSCTGMSPDNFTIHDVSTSCPLEVLVPNCKVVWRPGMTHKISWVPAGKSDNVKIEFSLDGGISWDSVENSTEDDGCYCWIIPHEIYSDQALIKISDVGDASCNDISDAAFTIGDPMAPFLMATDIMSDLNGSIVISEIIIGDNTTQMNAISLDFTYESSHLSFVEVLKGDLTSNWGVIEGNETSPGMLNITGVKQTGSAVPIGSHGSILQVVFHVACSACADCNQSHLSPDNLFEDLAGMNAYCGTYSYAGCCNLGDVNDDGAITPGDALCAFQIYLGGGSSTPECDSPCALTAADVNCSPNGITPGDALYIFQAYLAGKTPPLDCDPAALNKVLNDVKLRLEDKTAVSGERIEIPVQIRSASELSAFGMDLGYPAELLTFVGVKETALTSEWEALDAKENAEGVVTIGAYTAQAVSAAKADALLTVVFEVKENAEGSGDIWLSNTTDDIAEAELINARFSTMSDGVHKLGDIPSSYALEQNYPNPFNMESEIVYQLPDGGHVKLIVYNVSGRKIKTLVDSYADAGIHNARWNGKDDSGNDIASGIYFYKLETKNIILSKKMILMK